MIKHGKWKIPKNYAKYDLNTFKNKHVKYLLKKNPGRFHIFNCPSLSQPLAPCGSYLA
jgi:hypothetical protein